MTLCSEIMFTRKQVVVFLSLIVFAAAFRIAIVRWLPNDSPGDSIGYEQIARNLLEQHVYTHLDEAPFTPTNVRLPGYPLFLAAIYSVFGHTNNTAVRIVQALLDTGTCVLVALLAWLWQPDEQKKVATAMAAMALAAGNPFTTIYCATILTEVPSTFLIVAACIAATLAFRAEKIERELRWWAITGLITGIAVLFRPDMGLVTGAIGVLALMKLFRRQTQRWRQTILVGATLSVAFALVLMPWTIRNWRTLRVFQPLAPANANMPGEFVPLGYHRWLKTWVTDSEYQDQLLWDLGKEPVDVGDLPDTAFDSQAAHDRVEALFDKLNGWDTANASANQKAKPAKSPSPSATQSTAKAQPNSAAEPGDEEAEAEEQNETNSQPQLHDLTPDLDAGFGQIANERIARRPFRYYVLLPLRRAHALWFNTHSDFYPFSGNALPLLSPENTRAENFWLP